MHIWTMRAASSRFSFNHGSISLPDGARRTTLDPEMDIDYPEHIVERVNGARGTRQTRRRGRYVVDVAGHGAAIVRLAGTACAGLRGGRIGIGCRESGLAVFATTALSCELRGDQVVPIEPLYRKPARTPKYRTR